MTVLRDALSQAMMNKPREVDTTKPVKLQGSQYYWVDIEPQRITHKTRTPLPRIDPVYVPLKNIEKGAKLYFVDFSKHPEANADRQKAMREAIEQGKEFPLDTERNFGAVIAELDDADIARMGIQSGNVIGVFQVDQAGNIAEDVVLLTSGQQAILEGMKRSPMDKNGNYGKLVSSGHPNANANFAGGVLPTGFRFEQSAWENLKDGYKTVSQDTRVANGYRETTTVVDAKVIDFVSDETAPKMHAPAVKLQNVGPETYQLTIDKGGVEPFARISVENLNPAFAGEVEGKADEFGQVTLKFKGAAGDLLRFYLTNGGNHVGSSDSVELRII